MKGSFNLLIFVAESQFNIDTRAVDTNYRQMGLLKRMNGPEMLLPINGTPLYLLQEINGNITL